MYRVHSFFTLNTVTVMTIPSASDPIAFLRLEGLTKRLATPIVMTDSVKERLGAGFELIAFGEQPLRGHSSLQVWGVGGVPTASSGVALQ